MSDVLYLCDGKACDHPCSEFCKHTSDISHAVDFERSRFGNDFYVQKEMKEESKPRELIVVQTHRVLKKSNFDAFYNDLIEMRNRGVVLLPHYCEAVIVRDNVGITIKEN